MLTSIRISSQSKIMLRVMEWMLNMWILVKMTNDMNTSVIARKMLSNALCAKERKNQIQLELMLLQMMDDATMLFYGSMKIFLEQFQITPELLVFDKKLLIALAQSEIFGLLTMTKIIDRFMLFEAGAWYKISIVEMIHCF